METFRELTANEMESKTRVDLSVLPHFDPSKTECLPEQVELLLNAVEWGGKLDPNRKVRIAYVRSSRMLLYRVADPGPGFSFRDLTHAAVGQPADDPVAHMAVRDQLGIRPGGFGIAMTRSMADELIYNEAQNEVIFVKYLASDAS